MLGKTSWYSIDDVSGNDRHILLFYKKCQFCHLLPFAKVGQYNIFSTSFVSSLFKTVNYLLSFFLSISHLETIPQFSWLLNIHIMKIDNKFCMIHFWNNQEQGEHQVMSLLLPASSLQAACWKWRVHSPLLFDHAKHIVMLNYLHVTFKPKVVHQ